MTVLRDPMSKRRLNANKVAKQPKLKKDMAEFVASCEVRYNAEGHKYNLVDLLWKGHRGFISFNEKELTKQFEKWYYKLEDDLKEIEADKIEREKSDPWRRGGHWESEHDKNLRLLYELGKKVMDDVVDNILL